MNAQQATYDLARTIQDRGTMIGFDDAQALRRAEMTLHRWAEGECGDSNAYASFGIERDDDGTPYRVVFPHTANARRRTRIPDRERGALRRVAEICDRLGLHYYHQGDPRGCALYVDTAPIPSNDYTRAIACRR